MGAITLRVQMVGYSPHVDRSVTLRFRSQVEMTPDEVAALHEHHGSDGYIAFKSTPFADAEIESLPINHGKQKTPSQKLRATLYMYHERNRDKLGLPDFDSWYPMEVERIRERYYIDEPEG